MKYEDYEARVTALISNPDTAPTVAQEFLSEIKADSEAFASLEAGIAERDARIRDLQDTNMKLFLSQSAPAGEDDEEEKTADEILDELFKED